MAGKSRKRPHGHKSTSKLTISPSEQRKKIRESVLNAFKERIKKSPADSGALIVSKTSQSLSDNYSQSKELDKKKKSSTKESKGSPQCDIKNLTLSDADKPTKGESDIILDLSRRKKRKTRSERNKLHDKSKKKEKHCEVKKQITLAQQMMVNRPQKVQGERSACVITQNRLTKRLGLFNQGKKSNSIARDDIKLPSKLEHVVKDDLKKILGKEKDDSHHEAQRFSHSNDDEVMAPIYSRKTPSTKSSISLSRSGGPTPGNRMSMDEDADSTPACQTVPNSPDYVEIMERITIKVRPAKCFPTQDVIRSTTAELFKLIRLNCPLLVCDTKTPSKTTPHSHVSSDVVCRDLSPCLPPTPKKGSSKFNETISRAEAALSEFRAQNSYEKPPMYIPVKSEGDGATSGLNFKSIEPQKHVKQREKKDHLTSGCYCGTRTSLKFQQLLEAAASEAVHDRLNLGSHQCTGASGECGDPLANRRDLYDTGYSSTMAQSNLEQDQSSDVFGLYPKKYNNAYQSKAVVTQKLYPMADTSDLLYRRNAHDENRSFDLLDDMDMEYEPKSQRSSPEFYDPRTNLLWLDEKPSFLRDPSSPSKQLYPRRLY